MPGGDGTGPHGMGPRTGRIAGFCAGSEQPGFMNPTPGWGVGIGAVWGAGRGIRRRAGWGRGRGWRGYGLAETSEAAGSPPAEQGVLGQRLDQLQAEIGELRRLMGKAESLKPGGPGE